MEWIGFQLIGNPSFRRQSVGWMEVVMLLLIKSGVVIMNHAPANWNRELRAPAASPPLLARTVLVLQMYHTNW